MSGYLVLVDRLVAGVSISGVRFSLGGYPLKLPFWGWTKNKLAAFNVNVNMQKRTIRNRRHMLFRLIVKRFQQSWGYRRWVIYNQTKWLISDLLRGGES
ncbi:hypothetical protein ACOSZC_06580 [Marinobacter salsuginis]